MAKGVHPDQLDMLMWAETRPTAKIIDARKLFQKRTNDFVRLLIIGYRPPTSGGAEPVKIADVRRLRATAGRVADDTKGAA